MPMVKFFSPKFIVILLFVSIAVFGVTANISFAQLDIVATLLSGVNLLLLLILNIENSILALSGSLVDFLMQPTSILDQEIVADGWRISRDFANMFFVLILLAIALSFILFPRFQIKQALPRLLLVALLINFSLPIAGIFLDFANVFTSFFLNAATSGSGSITGNLADTLRLTETLSVLSENTDLTQLDLNQQAFKTLVFGIIFVGMMILIFASLAIMFLFRIGWLYMLLILLPIVLVASILPAGSKYFGQWSSRFFQWTFFAPVATFFIYLSVVSFESVLVGTLQNAQEHHQEIVILQKHAQEVLPIVQQIPM